MPFEMLLVIGRKNHGSCAYQQRPHAQHPLTLRVARAQSVFFRLESMLEFSNNKNRKQNCLMAARTRK